MESNVSNVLKELVFKSSVPNVQEILLSIMENVSVARIKLVAYAVIKLDAFNVARDISEQKKQVTMYMNVRNVVQLYNIAKNALTKKLVLNVLTTISSFGMMVNVDAQVEQDP
jgi:hypothetical protein